MVVLLGVLLGSLFITPSVAQAVCNWNDLSGCDEALIINKDAVCTDVPSCIIWFVNILFLLAVLVSFVYLVWGGLDYIMAGGDSGKAGGAQRKITNAVIGLVVVIVAWAVSTMVFNFFSAGAPSPLEDIGGGSGSSPINQGGSGGSVPHDPSGRTHPFVD